MSVGEPGEINHDRKMVDRDRTVLPEASDQNSDSEKKLVVAEEEHQTFDDGSPKFFALTTDADTACFLQMVEYPAINRIVVVASENAEKASKEYDRQVRQTSRYKGDDYLWP